MVLIACNVLGAGWVGRLREDVLIYDCADEISEFRQARMRKEAVLAQERELMKKADAVVMTSKSLYDSKSEYSRKTVLIRNAAEIVHFRASGSSGKIPKDIAHLKKPIVGFYGYLADWLDWPLIEYVVREGSEFDWVFIGPTTRELSTLKKLPNFYYLGKKPYEILPDYLGRFACAHIPFDRTPLTVNVNPVKLYEYLASGVPVVATPLPELEEFRDVCALAENPERYLSAVRHSIENDDSEKRKKRMDKVENETWDARVRDYCNLVIELLGEG